MSSASFKIVLFLACAPSFAALRHDSADDAALDGPSLEKESAKVAEPKAASGRAHKLAQPRDCVDPPSTYKDIMGYDCSAITAGILTDPGLALSYCSYYDDQDFTASGMCCGCYQSYGAFWWQPEPSATGDPHVRNIKGEKFDIMNPGKHVLLQLPRSAQPDAARLHVVADVQQVSDCLAFYMQGVTVSGSWVKSPLEFRVDGGNLTFGGLATGQASLLVGGTPVKSLQEFESLLPPGLAEVAALKVAEPKARKRVRMLAVKLNFPAGPQLAISFVRTNSARVGHQIDHVDFAGIRLGAAKMEIGGLLGLDDHDSAVALPQECTSNMAESLIGGSAEHLLEGETQAEERSLEVRIGDAVLPFGSYGSYE